MPNPLDDAKVYTLDDLESWETLRPGLPPSLAVLGHPVAHSVSPQMHNAALAYLVKEGHEKLKEWRYFKFDIEPDEMEEAFALLKKNNFKGANLTVPHKNAAAIAHLSQFPPRQPNEKLSFYIKRRKIRETVALNFGTKISFNTVTFLEKLKMDNTDGYGLVLALKRDVQVELKGKAVVILGAGGAASEAASECVRQKCAALWIGSRDEEKRRQLCELLEKTNNVVRLIPSKFNSETKVETKGFDISDTATAKQWPEDVVVINATTLGMKRDDPLPFDVSLLGKYACVFDMVYNRQGPTKFVDAARARDLHAADGLGMLIWQGAKSLTIWIKAHEGIEIKPESIAQTMMDAACTPLGLPPRHA
jgi:shikimate dehydrogenase